MNNPPMRSTSLCLLVLIGLVLTGCSAPTDSDTPAAATDSATQIKGNTSSQPVPLLSALENPSLGVDFVHDAGFSESYSIYEPLGSGVATLDVNNDGWLDVFFPQYGTGGVGSRLYLNNHGQGFEDISDQAGISDVRGLIFAAAADYNNDGLTDLLTGGENQLMLLANTGKNGFVDSGLVASPGGEQFFSGASWFDADADGWLDAWVSNYVDGSRPAECRQADGSRGFCPPSAYPDRTDLFLHNRQGKEFPPYAGPEITARAGLGVVAADFDNNGWPDIYVANDEEANQLFLNQNGQFGPDEALRRGAGLNLMGETEASMGVAVGDIDSNGFPDLYLTHYRNETNTIYYNHNGQFTDKTAQAGLATEVRPVTGFGTVFTDLNGDNRLDIVTVNGSVVTTDDADGHTNGRLHAEPVQVWLNTPAGFVYQQRLAKTLPLKVGRGLIAVDWDNDGDKDLISSNNNQSPTFLRNNSNPPHWLGLDLRCHQRPAIGTKVIAETADGLRWHRAVHTDGSYASSQDPRLLFYGLSGNDRIAIRWPGGQQQNLNPADVPGNSYAVVTCPASTQKAD